MVRGVGLGWVGLDSGTSAAGAATPTCVAMTAMAMAGVRCARGGPARRAGARGPRHCRLGARVPTTHGGRHSPIRTSQAQTARLSWQWAASSRFQRPSFPSSKLKKKRVSNVPTPPVSQPPLPAGLFGWYCYWLVALLISQHGAISQLQQTKQPAQTEH